MTTDHTTIVGHHVAQTIIPRHTRPMGGVDHGSSGRCLVEVQDGDGRMVRRLIWFLGFTTASEGVRGYGRKYVPARLDVHEAGHVLGTTIHNDGGRLSRPLLDKLRPQIDGRFGKGTTDAIKVGSTLVVMQADPTTSK